MFIKEFYDKDSSGRTRLFAEAKCVTCNKLFKREKRLFKSEYITCSLTCNNIAKGNTKLVTCDHCGTIFPRASAKVSVGKSGLNFCNRSCKEEAQKYNEAIMPDHYHTGSGINSYRDKAFSLYKHCCNRCGYDNVLALEVHHKDRNRHNNAAVNLEILCANCHTLEHKLGL